MKNKIAQITLLIFAVTMLMVSCKKDDNSSSNSTTVLNSTVQQGKWKITLFNESGNDETNHYTNYNFQFNADGSITATSSGSTVTGTWSSGNDDSQLKLILNFTANPFTELNDDWHVTEQNSSIIKLEDVSGGNGGTDYLTFEKI